MNSVGYKIAITKRGVQINFTTRLKNKTWHHFNTALGNKKLSS